MRTDEGKRRTYGMEVQETEFIRVITSLSQALMSPGCLRARWEASEQPSGPTGHLRFMSIHPGSGLLRKASATAGPRHRVETGPQRAKRKAFPSETSVSMRGVGTV